MTLPITHNAVTLPGDDDEGYPWLCSCGARDTEDTYDQAHHAVVGHLEQYRLAETPCANLPPGHHWHDLVTTLAHDLAGASSSFAHFTDADIHQAFVSAKAILMDIEPNADRRCQRVCRQWERDINIETES